MSFSPSISNNDCFIYRFISIVFLGISIISFIFNIRFILIDYRRFNPLVLSLIINSFITSIFSFPYITIQSLSCYPIKSYFICSIEGFICFTNGICVMYTMCLLALIQYIRLFNKSSLIYRIIEHKKNYFISYLCWFISLIWSLPPLMNIKPGLKREGQGFDCGLNWIDTDIRSRLYIFLAFIFIYFLPLFSILFTNIRILITIHKFIHRRYSLISTTTKSIPVNLRHRLIDMFTIAESNRLKRLRIDRRFVQATMITVLYYLLAWTPYAICGMIQMIVSMKHIDYELPSMLVTASALTAKLSVISQSWVYFYTVRPSNRRLSLSSTAFK